MNCLLGKVSLGSPRTPIFFNKHSQKFNRLHFCNIKMRKKTCKHEWIKLTNIDKHKIWYMIFIYANEIVHREKLVCFKCGEERR